MVENVEDVKGAGRSADFADGADLEEREALKFTQASLLKDFYVKPSRVARPTRNGSTGPRPRFFEACALRLERSERESKSSERLVAVLSFQFFSVSL
jgi:hypothetical protein